MKEFVIGLVAILTLTACSGRSSASIQGQWKLVSYGSSSNQTSALSNVGTSIEFSADGRMSGNVGCNSFGGDYKADGNTIEFGPIISTEMFCETVADQEAGVITVLQKKKNFVLDGNTLTITSADGNSSIVLERK